MTPKHASAPATPQKNRTWAIESPVRVPAASPGKALAVASPAKFQRGIIVEHIASEVIIFA